MKILSAQQMREADKFTIENEPVSSIDLMERAAKACFENICAATPLHSTFYIFCGKGNNGGDGLAIARILAHAKRKVEVFIIEHSEHTSEDFKTNLKRLEKIGSVKVHFIRSHAELVSVSHYFNKPQKQVQGDEAEVYLLDALLGTGINKPVEGILAETIKSINESGLPVISIDVPSGLYCDSKPDHSNIIKATRTLTFQRPKLTFLFADFFSYVGEVTVLDIGLNENFIEDLPSQNFVTTKKDVARLLVPRQRIAHKGNFGHALLIAGSKGKMGAAALASRACLRSGAGLLTAHVPACGYGIIQTSIPEAMASVDPNENFISSCPKLNSYNAIGIGPGIGTEKETAQALKVLIQECDVPLVLDADALNLLSENKTWLSFLPANTILTPHPKEFDRLTHAHTSDFDRLHTCKEFSRKHNVIVVLKGARTEIVDPAGNVFFNSSGNAALAKGGSGDVLTGMIVGLLARGYNEKHACVIATFLHGYAAGLYVKKYSEETMLANDIIELLPIAFNL